MTFYKTNLMVRIKKVKRPTLCEQRQRYTVKKVREKLIQKCYSKFYDFGYISTQTLYEQMWGHTLWLQLKY